MAFVKKLDVPTVFDEIKTGVTTSASLKKHEKERYSVWYNHFWETNRAMVGTTKANILWVGDHWQTILAYIHETYDPPKSSGNTLRNHLEGLANVLLAIDKTRFKEVTRPMFNLGLTTQQIIDKANEDSKLDDEDLKNYVSYRKLVAMRNHYETLWRADPKDLKLNIYHLLLAVNTYIPPLRLDWLDMHVYPPRLVDGRPAKPPTGPVTAPPEDTNNYLWESTPGEWSIVMNYDKIENKREQRGLTRQVMSLKDDIPGITDGKRLNGIINDSLRDAPRNYVLVGVRDKTRPMPASGFGSAMLAMFKSKKPLQNLLRKAYINYVHRVKLNGMELPERTLKEVANRMRHTLEVARGSYRKINLAEEDDDSPLVLPTKPEKPKSLPIVESRAPRSLPLIVPRSAANDSEDEVDDYRPPLLLRSAANDEPEEFKYPMLSGPAPSPVAPATRPTVPPPSVVAPPPSAKPKPYFNPAKYQAEYRVTHKTAIAAQKTAYFATNKHAILRSKLIGNLNNGVVKKPTKASILKYGLRQRPDNGLWETTQAADYKPSDYQLEDENVQA